MSGIQKHHESENLMQGVEEVFLLDADLEKSVLIG
jgi:hypothetical protein